MIQLLLIVQVLIAVALIGVVLLQRSDSDGTGLGGSGGGMGLLSGRQKANALTRTTAILAALFMINSLALSILTGHGGSIVDRIEAGKALSSEPTSKSTPLPGNKTIDGQPGVSTRSPTGAPTATPAPTQATPVQPTPVPSTASPAVTQAPASQPLEAPAAK